MKKLLKITDREYEEFNELFDEVDEVAIDQVAPEVVDGKKDVQISGNSVSEYDAAYIEVPPKNAVFGRVALEMIREKGVKTNHTSTGFFIASKKNYLYYVLHEKGVPAPKTVVVATEKASRNIEKELRGPLIARRLEELEESEAKKLDTVQEISDFAEGSEYDDDILLFHEYNSGDKYRCLIAGEQIISLKDRSDGWKFDEDSLSYSNISDEQREVVNKTKKALGTPILEVKLRGSEVYDLEPNPDLRLFKDVSGKNAFEDAAEALKGN
ncbi:MAG: RimK family alpha-L-glutamate ligase [Candidatus Nanohalobium sp.]